MTTTYAFTPYLWPVLLALASYVGLCAYGWTRRAIPAARPFFFVCLFILMWTLGHALELAATNPSGSLFWYVFQLNWMLPAVTASFLFILHFVRRDNWITLRRQTLLAVPAILTTVLILTSGRHSLFWSFPEPGGPLIVEPGPLGMVILGYSLVIGLGVSVLLIIHFVRRPADRWPTALILATYLLARVAFIVDTVNPHRYGPVDLAILALLPVAGAFAVALFQFRIFDPAWVAREAVIQRMGEGMLVLDSHSRVADLNAAGERLLGLTRREAKGRDTAELLPLFFDITSPAEGPWTELPLTLGVGPAARVVAVKQSTLSDDRGVPLGRLILLRDVTEQKQAESRLLEEQRAVATLLERDRVARELHDSTGQILAYVTIQAQAIRKNIDRGQADLAKAQLGQMVAAAGLAHADVRETIFSLKNDGPVDDRPFHERLDQFLRLYGAQYSIETDLVVEDGLDDPFSPEASVQLLRVIQESLSNARRHGGAQHVDVTVCRQNHHAQITITDDGHGFDTTQQAEHGHYGLSIMRERLAQIGATIAVDSQVGNGTCVVLIAPLSAHGEVTP